MNLSSYIQQPVFKIIRESAEEQNVKVYVIGGYVRDLLLEKKEPKDIDLVCVGSGIKLAQKVAEKIPGAHLSVFKNFGTAQVKTDEYELEFVGARKESYRHNSRNPIVENGTLEDDQKRRDFTINALSISINKEDYGKLYDPFNGLEDLKNKIIRTPLDPDKTYSDDPLRMMRAIRFATQLDFNIEPTSLKAIEKNKERIKIVSQERITDELNKIILSPVPSKGFKLLFNTGLLDMIFPELSALQGVETINGKSHKDNFYHTLKVLDNVAKKSDNLWLRWAALLHDIAKPATKRFDNEKGWTFHGHEDLGAKWVPGIFKRLKLPLDGKMKYVQKLVRLHLRPIALVKDEVTDSALRRLLFEAGDDLDDLMILCRADITSKNEAKVQRYLQNFDIVYQKLIDLEKRDKIKNFQPPVSGNEIINLLGISPSKTVGIIKEKIKDAILDGQIKNNKEEALKLMYEIAKEMNIAAKEK